MHVIMLPCMSTAVTLSDCQALLQETRSLAGFEQAGCRVVSDRVEKAAGRGGADSQQEQSPHSGSLQGA